MSMNGKHKMIKAILRRGWVALPINTLRLPCRSFLALGIVMGLGGFSPVWANSPEEQILFPVQSLSLPPLGDLNDYIPAPSDRLVLDLSDRRLYHYQGDEQVAAYPVAVGRDGWETPTGEFKIFQRVANPTWQHPFTQELVPPGPDNPLGARWLGFWTDGQNFIGFHGTPNENLIGQAVSHGCVRMRNADIEHLFEQVDIGTPVTVRS